MIDFIKMWLLLRALDEEEDRSTESEALAGEYYRQGLNCFMDKHDFVVAMSRLNFLVFAFPLWLRRVITRKDIKMRGGTVPNKRKLRRIYLLLDEADDFLENPHDPDTNKLEAGKIRLCGKKDKKATFFTSYLGGLETLLATYPRAWLVIVAVTSSPVWFPFIKQVAVGPFCGLVDWC